MMGALVYPFDPSEGSLPPAEHDNLWSLNGTNEVLFLTLPHTIHKAVDKLRALIPLSS